MNLFIKYSKNSSIGKHFILKSFVNGKLKIPPVFSVTRPFRNNFNADFLPNKYFLLWMLK